ncbi:MAG: DUF2812 domain-containing protein [Oscillospiraceae bacterium]|jgi:hypothetical protein|nr:DUF2812 domain-containing protein [Oscillospiraceae bacterium]
MNTKSYLLPVFRKFIPADLENWIEKMALEGWNLEKLNTFSVFLLTFKKTEPKQYRYVYDLNILGVGKLKGYKHTYEQFGWEYVGRFNANTYLWRKEYTGERPESFTIENVRSARAALSAMSVVPVSFAVISSACRQVRRRP